MQTIQPASTTFRYFSSKTRRSFSMSSELRLGVWSSTWKILSIEFFEPHEREVAQPPRHVDAGEERIGVDEGEGSQDALDLAFAVAADRDDPRVDDGLVDRKSTRLNSSHT